MTVVNLLDRPTYGFRQIDRILKLRGGTSARWIDGYFRGEKFYPPIVRQEHSGVPIATWGEFVESRLLSEYRGLGVSMLRLREVVKRLRDEYHTAYPLATAKPFVFGKELVAEVQSEVGLEDEMHLVEIRTGQWILTERAERFFQSVVWSNEGIARSITPRSELPDVQINPEIAFGEPTVRSIRTEVLAEEFRTGSSASQISHMFELPEDLVRAALDFEGFAIAV